MLEFLKLLKEKEKIKEERKKEEDNNSFLTSLVLNEYVNFKLYVEKGYGFGMNLGYSIYTLDEEDLEYFKRKFCKNIDKEKRDKIAKLESEYNEVKC